MKACVLYRPDSEFARMVEEYSHDIKRMKGIVLELVDLNTRDGAAMATLYDIVRYPAVLVIREDGGIVKEWQGEILPLMTELASYLV